MSPGARYIALVVGLLVFSVGVCIMLAVVATSDPGFAVEKNYYQKAVHFDELRGEEASSEKLGWRLALEPLTVSPESPVVISLRDGFGHPVEGLRGTVEAFANARSGTRVTAEFEPLGEGRYRARVDVSRPGQWEVRVRLERGAERFLETHRVTVDRLRDAESAS